MNIKKYHLSIRISEKDKLKIKKKSENINMKISDYIRTICLETKGEKINMFNVAIIIQEITDYMKEKYDKDELIKKNFIIGIESKKKQKKTKDARLSVRFSKDDKIKIEKKANSLGMNISDYIRYVCLSTIDEEITTIELVYVVTIIQDMDNYVKEKYGKDIFIREANEKLWNSLL